MKRPNLRLICVPESAGENGTKLENTLQDIIQENFPSIPTFKFRKYREYHEDTPQEETTPRHITDRFNKLEMKEKMLRVAREKTQNSHKGKPIRLIVDLSAETLQARGE